MYNPCHRTVALVLAFRCDGWRGVEWGRDATGRNGTRSDGTGRTAGGDKHVQQTSLLYTYARTCIPDAKYSEERMSQRLG